jgi:predicted  nucleic acid-binding Zn-ribbon protein
MSCVRNLQDEIKFLKDNQTKMMDMMQRITSGFENEETRRIKAEEELAAVKTQLSDLAKQLTNDRPRMTEQTTPPPSPPPAMARRMA